MHLDVSQKPFRARIWRENAGAHDRDADVVRACAVEMRLDISQPLCVREFASKMPRTRTASHTLREPARSKCTSTLHKSHFMRKLTGKMPQTKTAPHACASLRNRNAHGHWNPFMQKFKGKMARLRSTMPVCARQRSRNAHGCHKSQLVREFIGKMARPGPLCENFQQKCKMEHPDQAPASALTVRNTSVWTRGLGNCLGLPHWMCYGLLQIRLFLKQRFLCQWWNEQVLFPKLVQGNPLTWWWNRYFPAIFFSTLWSTAGSRR